MQQKSDHELSAIAYSWLSQTGNKINESYCTEEINGHPDYPSLTALTDFLESGGLDYEAVQANASYIHEFNYPLLAHIKQPGNEYLHMVADATAWEKEKEVTKEWSGIVLYTVKGSLWHNEENELLQKTQQKNKAVAAAFIAAGIIFFTASVFAYSYWPVNIFGLLSLAGLAVSIAASGAELGYQGTLVKQVCGTVSNGGCEKVLRSKFAKGFAGITPADTSVLYFTTQFALYLAGCRYHPLLAGIINIGFGGIAVAAWSIYTQAVKLKEWCALCLCIVGVLLLQSVISFINTDTSYTSGTYISCISFGLCALLFTLAFIPLKQLIKTSSNQRKELTALKKWKTDASLFLTQLDAEPPADISIWENDLLLGDAHAPVRITVACNPYCSPCARSHETLDSLLEKFAGKISVQVRLLCHTHNEKDTRTVAVRAILQKAAELNDNSMLHEMLTDWFHWMNLDKWQQKWQPDNKTDVMHVLQQHENWMNETGITHTPTFFINGKRMPGRYQLNDLEKLIPQLAGALTVQ
ncbi:thioredoxin domain-containing protein [Chitinophagaceae bacterium MMS25-I14]